MALGTLTIDLVAQTARLERGLNRANHLADRSATNMERRLRRTQNIARGVAGGILIAGGAVIGMYRSQAEELDNLAKQSDKLGALPETLAAIRFAGEQTGVVISTMDMALQRFIRRLAEAAEGTGEAQDALKELNVDAQELVNLPLGQVLAIIADRFDEVDTQADRVRLAMKLFDSEGVSLVNTLALGSDGLREMRKTADDLGITVSRIDLQKVEDANDAANRLARAADGLSNSLTIRMAPALETVFDWLTKITSEQGFVEQTFGTMQFLAEQFAAAIHGAASNDIVRLRDELKQINGTLEEWGNILPPEDIESMQKRKQQLLELIALRESLATSQTVIGINQGNDQPEDAGGPPQSTINAFESLVTTMQRRADLMGRESELAKVLWDIENGRFSDLDEARQDELRALAEKLDFLKMEEAAMAKLADEEQKRRQKNEAFVDEAARGFQRSMANYLFDPFDEGLDGMLRGFGRTMQRMAAEALSAKIGEKIFGFLGNLGGSGGGGLLGIFAGLFDNGGYIPPGQVGVVAEKRREIVDLNGRGYLVPGPARVTSSAATAAAMGGGNVTVNVHNPAGMQIGQQVRREGGQTVIDIMVESWEAAARDGVFDDVLYNSFGVNRAHAPGR